MAASATGISDTAPGDRRRTSSAKGANHASSWARNPMVRIPQVPYAAPSVSAPSAARRPNSTG